MNKTKKRILSVSRVMFNEKGYSNVTIRMIALQLNMSSGNLNYHFKKREDILEALYFEMVEVFDDRVKNISSTEISLETIKNDIIESLFRMIEYRFFWTDLYNILRLNEKLKKHFLNAYQERFNGYKYLFKDIQEKGILDSFRFESERDFLIERMIDYSNTWLYNSLIYEIEINKGYVASRSENLMGMLYPYLTDLGKSQYKMVFPKLF
mgnify:CR=1 FL=1